MHRAQKQKKERKLDKQKTTLEQTGESSHDGMLPVPTTPRTPGSMPPPSPYALQPQNSSKVAIPRLPRGSDAHSRAASASGDQVKIAHACEACRQRKTKCNGDRPKCKHCEDLKLHCVYVDGKRDRVKKCGPELCQQHQLLMRLQRI